MGKVSKKLRVRKKYNYDTNRRNQWKKKNRKVCIADSNIRGAWDDKASVKANLADMGIAYNPNRSVPLARTSNAVLTSSNPGSSKKSKQKEFVVHRLEEEAAHKAAGKFRLPQSDVLFCIYMMEKYGEDHKAMARDKTNYYQETPKQIRRKIKVFKGIPQQYNDYLEKKAAGTIDADSLV